MILSNFSDWEFVKQIAFILWIMVIIILVIGIISSRIHYKKSKSYFSIGLIMLCIGFIIGRIFRIIVSFYIGDNPIGSYEVDALITLNINIWILIGVIFTLGAVSFLNNKIKGKLFIIFWITLTIASILILYLIVSLIELNIGKLPTIKPFEGVSLLYQNIALVSSWMGYLILIYFIEKVSIDLFQIHKTKYLFTIFTGLAIIFTLIEDFTGTVTYILWVLFIVSMAGLGLIFLYMAVISTGKVRRNSLCVVVGHLFMVFSFGFDVPFGFLVFGIFSKTILLILAPIFQIIGLFFYFRGLLPIILPK